MKITTREEIIAACATDPEQVADLLLGLLARIQELEANVKALLVRGCTTLK